MLTQFDSNQLQEVELLVHSFDHAEREDDPADRDNESQSARNRVNNHTETVSSIHGADDLPA